MHTLCRTIVITVLCSFMGLHTVIAAESKATGKKKVVYEKETMIRFDDSVIEGKIIKPDGFFLLRQKPKRWQDLIKVRENFDPELGEMKFQF